MTSFRFGRYVVSVQPAVYVMPVYQKTDSSEFASTESSASDTTRGENSSTVTHRLLIPIPKFSLVAAGFSDDLTPEMFEDKT